MKCNYDCLHCIHPDCVKDTKTQDNPETHKKYYQAHRKERLAYQKAYNDAHKTDRHEQSKKRWANMTTEQKQRELEKGRENYRKRKEKAIETIQSKRILQAI